MGEEKLTSLHDQVIAESQIEALAGRFRGTLIRPADDGYETARRIWNASIDKHPGLIARCAGVADVIDVVRFARRNDLLLSIRGGGHNVAGRALCDGGVVLDLSAMKGIRVDSRERTVTVEGGATLGDVDRETHAFGMAVPAGVVSKTGIAGLTLGGGVGWLVRKYGLTCDNVLSFDVVTAEGNPVTASAQEHEDLFWALRGGGGNFGVVTSFKFRLRPVATVLGGMLVYPRADAPELCRFFRRFTASAPEELTAYTAFLHTPDGVPAVAVILCYCGDLQRGEEVIKPLREFGSPLMDAIEPMPFPQMQSLLDEAFPDGNFNYWKAVFLRELGEEVIELLVEHAGRATSPLSAVVVEYYGGAAGRVGVSETAFAHRKELYDVGIMAQWTDPAESQQHIAWTRKLADALQVHASGGPFLNFMSEASDEVIRSSFGPNYERLVAVKTKYDPTNFFRVNQNIKPSAG